MDRKWHRFTPLALLGLFLIVACPWPRRSPWTSRRRRTSAATPSATRRRNRRTLVTLDDQFLPPTTLSVDEPELFCPPTSKNGLEIEEPEEHLTTYNAPWPLEPDLIVSTEDQFGPRTLAVVGARELYVPTEKNELGFPDELNHYWCYEALGPRVRQRVTLEDQFATQTVRVERPHRFCNPVEKTFMGDTSRIFEREVHLTCYETFTPQKTRAQTFAVDNQFETDMFTVTSQQLLCVPSAKLGVTPGSAAPRNAPRRPWRPRSSATRCWSWANSDADPLLAAASNGVAVASG